MLKKIFKLLLLLVFALVAFLILNTLTDNTILTAEKFSNPFK